MKSKLNCRRLPEKITKIIAILWSRHLKHCNEMSKGYCNEMGKAVRYFEKLRKNSEGKSSAGFSLWFEIAQTPAKVFLSVNFAKFLRKPIL